MAPSRRCLASTGCCRCPERCLLSCVHRVPCSAACTLSPKVKLLATCTDCPTLQRVHARRHLAALQPRGSRAWQQRSAGQRRRVANSARRKRPSPAGLWRCPGQADGPIMMLRDMMHPADDQLGRLTTSWWGGMVVGASCSAALGAWGPPRRGTPVWGSGRG